MRPPVSPTQRRRQEPRKKPDQDCLLLHDTPPGLIDSRQGVHTIIATLSLSNGLARAELDRDLQRPSYSQRCSGKLCWTSRARARPGSRQAFRVQAQAFPPFIASEATHAKARKRKPLAIGQSEFHRPQLSSNLGLMKVGGIPAAPHVCEIGLPPMRVKKSLVKMVAMAAPAKAIFGRRLPREWEGVVLCVALYRC
jgi:hypothetical protein